MVITGIIKKKNIFNNFYYWINERVKSKKMILCIFSLITGILPIPGRIIISSSVFDTLFVKKSKQLGIVSYLFTHHYYLWSPLEKTVILPIAVFSLNYLDFIGYIWYILLSYLIFSFIYLFVFVKNEDINIVITKNTNNDFIYFISILVTIIFLINEYNPLICLFFLLVLFVIKSKTFDIRELLSYINFKVLFLLSIILIILSLTSYFYGDIFSLYGKIFDQNFVIVCIISFIISFILGSSSKYAGIVVFLCQIYGLEYLTFFIVLEYCAYLLSPFHKCVFICIGYYKMDIIYYYKIIGLLCLILILTVMGV